MGLFFVFISFILELTKRPRKDVATLQALKGLYMYLVATLDLDNKIRHYQFEEREDAYHFYRKKGYDVKIIKVSLYIYNKKDYENPLTLIYRNDTSFYNI